MLAAVPFDASRTSNAAVVPDVLNIRLLVKVPAPVDDDFVKAARPDVALTETTATRTLTTPIGTRTRRGTGDAQPPCHVIADDRLINCLRVVGGLLGVEGERR